MNSFITADRHTGFKEKWLFVKVHCEFVLKRIGVENNIKTLSITPS